MKTTNLLITCPATYPNKVAVIRSLRTLTGLGLKETKDISENTLQQSIDILSTVTNTVFEEQCRIMRTEGVIVGTRADNLVNELRALGIEALRLEEDELAEEILQLVLVEKIRRSG